MHFTMCPKCKSEYRITRQVTETKETNKEVCRVCGTKLIGWRQSRTTYKAKLKVKRKMHLSSKRV